jgi:ribose 5-phosphate isomerase B
MTISIGNDHAGTAYKFAIIKALENKGITVINHGTNANDSVDYPDFAHLVAQDIENKTAHLGIVICGSGNGIAMTVNKHPNVRAA